MVKIVCMEMSKERRNERKIKTVMSWSDLFNKKAILRQGLSIFKNEP